MHNLPGGAAGPDNGANAPDDMDPWPVLVGGDDGGGHRFRAFGVQMSRHRALLAARPDKQIVADAPLARLATAELAAVEGGAGGGGGANVVCRGCRWWGVGR